MFGYPSGNSTQSNNDVFPCVSNTATSAPVTYVSGTPVINSTDLSSDAFGVNMSITRSWTGLNDASYLGNGWNVSALPYLVLKRNQYYVHEGIVTVVSPTSGNKDFFYDKGYTVLTPRYDSTDSMTYTPPATVSGNNVPGYFTLTEADGSTTTFWDVPRVLQSGDDQYLDVNGSGDYYDRIYSGGTYAQEPSNQWYDTSNYGMTGTTTGLYVLGAFRSYSDASGKLQVTNSYTFSGNSIASETLTRTDGSGQFEQFVFAYNTVSNAQTGAAAREVTEITLRRGAGTFGSYDASTVGSWTKIRAAEYNYYTGTTLDYSGAVTDASDGRLGDLETVQILDYQRNPSVGEDVSDKYYQYYKFHGYVYSGVDYPYDGPANGFASSNDSGSGGTGGTDTTFPAETGDQSGAGHNLDDDAVWSGLKAVVEDASLARLKADYSSYRTVSNADLTSYADHFFWYERYNGKEVGDIDTNVTYYRAVQETALGAGCTACSGGIGTFRYTYTNDGAPQRADFYAKVMNGFGDAVNNFANVWVIKSTEYLPDTTNADANSDGIVDADQWDDNDRSVAYVDQMGLPILKVLKEYSQSNELVDYDMTDYFSPDSSVTFGSAAGLYQPGDIIEIRGSTDPTLALFNGTWLVTATTDHSFTLSMPGLAWEYLGDSGTFAGSGALSSEVYLTYNRYDQQGHVLYTMQGSALRGYSEGAYEGDLINWDESVDNTFLGYGRWDGGKITVNVYGTNTTSGLGSGASLSGTDGASGSVSGYLSDTYVVDGFSGIASGSLIPVASYKYYQHTYGSQAVYPVASVLQHWDANGDGTLGSSEGSLTQYTYTYRPDGSSVPTNRIQSRTTFEPTVTEAHNGSGSSNTVTVVYDALGRTTWTRDEDGFITYTAYDPASGTVIKTIADVDTSQTSTFTGLPSGWTSVATGGLNLVTTDEVDGIGRVTKETSPAGRVTLTRYLDSAHEMIVYPGWHQIGTTGTWAATGAISIFRTYWPTAYSGSLAPSDQRIVYLENLSLQAQTFSTNVPTGTESLTVTQGTISSWTRKLTNNAGQVVESDAYFSLGTSTYSGSDAHVGAAATSTAAGNYFATSMAYDSRGQLKRTQDPNGTITRYLYDVRTNLVATYVGTDDTPTTNYWSPVTTFTPTNGTNAWTSANIAGTNMVRTSGATYDVDGNRRTEITFTGTDAASGRTTYNWYDWRDRLVASKSGAAVDLAGQPDPSGEGTNVQRPLVVYAFDNRNILTSVSQYDGDGVTITFSGGALSPVDAGKLWGLTTSARDEMGREYAAKTFSVDPVNGTYSTSAYVGTFTWYDNRGNAVKVESPGGLVTKSVYDGASRNTVAYYTDGGGDPAPGVTNNWSAALTVTGDNVLEQQETQFDRDGRPVLTTDRQRYHNDTHTGALGSVTSTGSVAKARVSYTAYFYDAAARLTDTLEVGTNGGSAYTLPTNAPTSSTATGILTHTNYDVAGGSTGAYAGLWATEVINPKGVSYRTYVNPLEEKVWTISNYDGGTQTSTGNVRTSYAYDGAGHTIDMKAYTSPSAYQETAYIYGVGPASGSSISTFNLIRKVDYPDLTTGAASTSQEETYSYDTEGKSKTYSDRNVTLHVYTYDELGRLVQDAATPTGTNAYHVDVTVAKLAYAYDAAGRLTEVTSLSSTDSVVNSLTRTYNGFGQLAAEVQPGGTVTYTYSTPDPEGSGLNASRLTGMTYGHESLAYIYASGVDNTISRLSGIVTEALSGSGTTTAEGYTYLGLSTVVARSNPEVGANAGLTLIGSTTSASTGDIYVGLDLFGRTVDQKWLDAGGSAQDEFKYTYDLDSNPIARVNALSAVNGEAYTYDALDRLNGFARGTVTVTGTTIPTVTATGTTASQSWNYDSLGNWATMSFNGSTTSSTFNAQNQLTTNGATASTLAYDANGNRSKDENGGLLKYDAWNRLASWATPNGAVEVRYAYDALGRRVGTSETLVKGDFNRDGVFTSADFNEGFYIAGDPDDPDHPATERLPAGMTYAELLAIGDYDGNGTFTYDDMDQISGFFDDFDYGGHDDGDGNYIPPYDGHGLGDVTLTTTYTYSPAGQVLVETIPDGDGGTSGTYDYIWSPAYVNAMVARDTFDEAGSQSLRAYVRQDANYDVTSIVASTDGSSWSTRERYRYSAYGVRSVLSSSFAALTTTSYDFWQGFQGGEYDPVNGLIQFGLRNYDASSGVWCQSDPEGYVDGANTYEYVGDNPYTFVDPTGLCQTYDRTIYINNSLSVTIPTAGLPITARGRIELTASAIINVCPCPCDPNLKQITGSVRVSGSGVLSATYGYDDKFEKGGASFRAWGGAQLRLSGTIAGSASFKGGCGEHPSVDFCVLYGLQGMLRVGGEIRIQYSYWSWTTGFYGYGQVTASGRACFHADEHNVTFEGNSFSGFHGSVGVKVCAGVCYTFDWPIF